jgi:WD40 repeat protein
LFTLDGHQGRVRLGQFSPDGTLIATCGDDRTARLWDSTNGKLQSTLGEHAKAVVKLEFSPDGRVLATEGGSSTVTFWNTRTGRKLSQWEDKSRLSPHCIEFSRDSQFAAVAVLSQAHVIDLESGMEFASVKFSDEIYSLEFSDDGYSLVAGMGAGFNSSNSTVARRPLALAIDNVGEVEELLQRNSRWILRNGRLVPRLTEESSKAP